MLNHHHQPCIRGCWRYQCWCCQIPKESTGLCRCLDVDTWPFPKPAGRGRRLTMDYHWEQAVTTWLGEVWGAASLLERGFLQPQADGMHTDSMWFVGFKRWQCCCNFLSHGWFQDIYWYFRIHQWIMTIHDIWWATYNIMIHCPNTEILHLANGFWSRWDPSRRFLARDNQSDKNGDRSGDTWCLDFMISVNYKQLTAWNQKTRESDWVY